LLNSFLHNYVGQIQRAAVLNYRFGYLRRDIQRQLKVSVIAMARLILGELKNLTVVGVASTFITDSPSFDTSETSEVEIVRPWLLVRSAKMAL
jgi:hypothetical protein